MANINENYQKLPGSYLFAEIARRVKEYGQEHPDAQLIRLGIGDVTRPLAPAVVEAMEKAAREMGHAETFRGYGPDYGYDFLIQASLDNDYQGLGIQADEVFVSDGAKCDVANVQELFSDDAVVAVTDPVYPVYVDSNAMAGRAGSYAQDRWDRLCYLPCTAENGFVPPLPQHYVDAIYLCFPNNPTGVALTLPELQRYVDWAVQNGVLIFYDAAYSAFITSSTVPHTIYECRGAKSCAIECGSFSKLAGFTGVRCGYCVVPRELYGGTLHRMWSRMQSAHRNGVSYPVQRAAEAVFTPQGMRDCRENIDYYMNTARVIRNALRGAGLEVFGGVDAPYVWLKTPGGISGWQFLDFLLENAQVAGTPGEGFGPSGAGYFRLTAFSTAEHTQ